MEGEREITEEGRDISSCCRLIIKIFNSVFLAIDFAVSSTKMQERKEEKVRTTHLG